MTTVRPPRTEDFGQWQVLWAGYNAFYGREGPTAVPDEVTRATWSRFLDSYEPVHAVLAERDGELVGLAHFIYHRTTTQISPTCYLQDLFTTVLARRSGIGQALISAVCAHAESAGAQQVYWQTHETNAVARSLYDSIAERSGFIVYRKRLVASAGSSPPRGERSGEGDEPDPRSGKA